MSQATLPAAVLDLREQIVRIDRMIAETRKFQEESDKFAAETRKVSRDYALAPWLAILGIAGGLVTLAGALAKWLGG